MNPIAIGLFSALAGLLAGYAIRALLGRWQGDSIEKQAAAKLAEAEREARNRQKEAEIQARAEVVQAREEFEQSTKLRRKELQDFDDRLTQREENLDRKLKVVEAKEQAAAERRQRLQAEGEALARRSQELECLHAEAQARLQKLAGMTQEEARRELRQKVEDEVRAETGALLRRLQEEARETADRDAQNYVALAVQRFAAPHAGDAMTCTISLPSDDLKGRIIGREGRNVRAFESATDIRQYEVALLAVVGIGGADHEIRVNAHDVARYVYVINSDKGD